jgi:hypothetical protein
LAKQLEPVKPTIWNVYKIVAKLVFLGYIAKNEAQAIDIASEVALRH